MPDCADMRVAIRIQTPVAKNGGSPLASDYPLPDAEADLRRHQQQNALAGSNLPVVLLETAMIHGYTIECPACGFTGDAGYFEPSCADECTCPKCICEFTFVVKEQLQDKVKRLEAALAKAVDPKFSVQLSDRINSLEAKNAELKEQNDSIMASFDQLAAVGCVNAHEAVETIKRLRAIVDRLMNAYRGVDEYAAFTPEHCRKSAVFLETAISIAREAAKAKTIVDKLPVDATGQTMIPGQPAYRIREDGLIQECQFWQSSLHGDHVVWFRGPVHDEGLLARDCYSTRELAEAAAKEGVK